MTDQKRARCSHCLRKLRPKTMRYTAFRNRSFPGTWTDWLNHRRDCPRYGQAPDA